MSLTEPEFAAIVDAGCPCGSKEVQVEALVIEKINLHAGDPLGTPTWGYKGEELVQRTFAIDCVRCKTSLYAATACPDCGSEGGIERALDTESATPMPEACGECGSDKLTVHALVPAKVVHGAGRAPKARSNVAPEDEGFHVERVVCKICLHTVKHRGGCVLCGA